MWLCRHVGDKLKITEPTMFVDGAQAVDTVLRRAQLAGRTEVWQAGQLPDYFADLLDENEEIIGHVMLDRGSFNALKNHRMRCKYVAW